MISLYFPHFITTIHVLLITYVSGEFLEIKGNIVTTKYGSNEPDEDQDIIKRYNNYKLSLALSVCSFFGYTYLIFVCLFE